MVNQKLTNLCQFLFLILLASLNSVDADSNIAFWSNEYASLSVFPNCSVANEWHLQYANITNKMDTDQVINFSFVFPEQLELGEIQYLKRVYDEGNGTWMWIWESYTDQITHLEHKGKHYYYSLNVNFQANSNRYVRWVYKTQSSSGKWDLIIWRGSVFNPTLKWELDPYWINNASGGSDVYDIVMDGILYRVHVFTANGFFNITSGITEIDLLIVAGGGGGGSDAGGGGGAGGLIYEAKYNVSNGSYSIIIGGGGSPGNDGGDSVFDIFTAVGGGGGAQWNGNAGNDGGSGGGAGGTSGGATSNYGDGVEGQGYRGGAALYRSAFGGGGGAGEIGNTGVGNPTNQGGDGGVGVDMSFYFGTTYGESGWFAGGGAGGSCYNAVSGGSGGSGGGGDGQYSGHASTVGVVNTGGGGGGAYGEFGGGSGKAGGSGVVIIRYIIINLQVEEFGGGFGDVQVGIEHSLTINITNNDINYSSVINNWTTNNSYFYFTFVDLIISPSGSNTTNVYVCLDSYVNNNITANMSIKGTNATRVYFLVSVMSSTPIIGVNISVDYGDIEIGVQSNITITFTELGGINPLSIISYTSNCSNFTSDLTMLSIGAGSTNNTILMFQSNVYTSTRIIGNITWIPNITLGSINSNFTIAFAYLWMLTYNNISDWQRSVDNETYSTYLNLYGGNSSTSLMFFTNFSFSRNDDNVFSAGLPTVLAYTFFVSNITIGLNYSFSGNTWTISNVTANIKLGSLDLGVYYLDGRVINITYNSVFEWDSTVNITVLNCTGMEHPAYLEIYNIVLYGINATNYTDEDYWEYSYENTFGTDYELELDAVLDLDGTLDSTSSRYMNDTDFQNICSLSTWYSSGAIWNNEDGNPHLDYYDNSFMYHMGRATWLGYATYPIFYAEIVVDIDSFYYADFSKIKFDIECILIYLSSYGHHETDGTGVEVTLSNNAETKQIKWSYDRSGYVNWSYSFTWTKSNDDSDSYTGIGDEAIDKMVILLDHKLWDYWSDDFIWQGVWFNMTNIEIDTSITEVDLQEFNEECYLTRNVSNITLGISDEYLIRIFCDNITNKTMYNSYTGILDITTEEGIYQVFIVIDSYVPTFNSSLDLDWGDCVVGDIHTQILQTWNETRAYITYEIYYTGVYQSNYSDDSIGQTNENITISVESSFVNYHFTSIIIATDDPNTPNYTYLTYLRVTPSYTTYIDYGEVTNGVQFLNVYNTYGLDGLYIEVDYESVDEMEYSTIYNEYYFRVDQNTKAELRFKAQFIHNFITFTMRRSSGTPNIYYRLNDGSWISVSGIGTNWTDITLSVLCQDEYGVFQENNEIEFYISSGADYVEIQLADDNSTNYSSRFYESGSWYDNTFVLRHDIESRDVWTEDEEYNISAGEGYTFYMYYVPTDFKHITGNITLNIHDLNLTYRMTLYVPFSVTASATYTVLTTINIEAMVLDTFSLIFQADEDLTIEAINISRSWVVMSIDYTDISMTTGDNVTMRFNATTPYQSAQYTNYDVVISISTDEEIVRYIFTVRAELKAHLSTDLDNLSYTIDTGEMSLIVFTLENTGNWNETYTIKVYRRTGYSHTATYQASVNEITLGAGGESTLNFTYESSLSGTDCIVIEIVSSNGSTLHYVEIEYTIEIAVIGEYNETLSFVLLAILIAGIIAIIIYLSRNKEIKDEIVEKIKNNVFKIIAITCVVVAFLLIVASYTGVIRLKLPVTGTKIGW